jgi:outer membrane protein assembly factor BamB
MAYGGSSLYEAKRPSKRYVVLILAISAWLLAACTGQLANANWPGLSASGNTVYVSYGNGVLAYNVETQSEEWVFSPSPGRLAFYAAPAIADDGRVVVGDYGAAQGFLSPGVVVSVYGLQAGANGDPEALWTVNNIASDRIVAPPLQVDGRVYIGTADNQIVALEAGDGSELWRFETGHSVWGQPSYKEGVLYVASLDKNVYALDAESGAVIWSTLLGGAIASKIAIDTNLIYVTSFDRHLHAIERTSGEIVWSVPATDWIWGAPIFSENVVYFADAMGAVFAVDALAGDLLWTTQVQGQVQTTPNLYDGILYVTSDKENPDARDPLGVLTAISVEDGGDMLWQQELTVPIYTDPVVVSDQVVVAVQGTESLLVAFDRLTGTKRWEIASPDASR